MIKAEHKKYAHWLFNLYLNRIIRNYFTDFFIVGDVPVLNHNRGLIITPNHFSWWDGFFIYFLMKKYSSRNIYIMMLEEQLKKYSFFKNLGAFSINQQNPKSIVETLKYASSLVSSESYLVTYPQGEIEPYEKRPLKVKEGLIKIIEKAKSDTDVLPVVFKIHHSNQRKPYIYCMFGTPIPGERVIKSFNYFSESFNELIAKLDNIFLISSKKSLFNK